MAPCIIPSCGRPHVARGFCATHYKRYKRHGDAAIHVPIGGFFPTLEERFWSKVNRSGGPTSCWPWQGFVRPDGYGAFYHHDIVHPGHYRAAHRMAYELIYGSIPEGKQLDHLCRRRDCVNPLRLEPVTQAENIRRGLGHLSLAKAVEAAAKKKREATHCKRGHAFDESNTYWNPDGRRGCKVCKNESQRRRKIHHNLLQT